MKVKFNQYIRRAEMQIGFFMLWTGCLPRHKRKTFFPVQGF